MGTVHAEITFKNVRDEVFAKEGFIRAGDIRTAAVTAVVDTGSMYMVITEELRQKLGLEIKGETIARIASGERIISKLTEAVEVQWKDRDIILQTLVIPGAKNVLLGALALEAMDLMVNPVTQELIGVHGDQVEILAL